MPPPPVGPSPLVCQKCKRSLLIHDEKPVSEAAVLTFATGHLTDSEEERTRLMQRDTWAIEQLGEAFVMAPTTRCKSCSPPSGLIPST